MSVDSMLYKTLHSGDVSSDKTETLGCEFHRPTGRSSSMKAVVEVPFMRRRVVCRGGGT